MRSITEAPGPDLNILRQFSSPLGHMIRVVPNSATTLAFRTFVKRQPPCPAATTTLADFLSRCDVAYFK